MSEEYILDHLSIARANMYWAAIAEEHNLEKQGPDYRDMEIIKRLEAEDDPK